jgi:hypothetical protein
MARWPILHKSSLLLPAALVLLGVWPADAAEQRFRGDYAVTLYGLPIGRSTFVSRFGGGRFEVEGVASSAGLARVFDNTEVRTTVAGRLAEDRLRPERYRLAYRSGKQEREVEIAFRGGRVARTRVTPPPRPRDGEWIAVTTDHLAGVVDPLTATIVAARSPKEVCARTLRVYDGTARLDLQLHLVRVAEMSVAGYKGPAVECRARLRPVAGYRPSDRSLSYFRSDIRIAFAPLGTTGLHAPIRATFGTEIGTVAVEATRFGLNE